MTSSLQTSESSQHTKLGMLLENAPLSNVHEIPVINPLKVDLPRCLIPFSEAVSQKCRDFNCWVCFYEKDSAFECLWNNPQRYLSRLRKFQGVISPDYSFSLTSPWAEQFFQFLRGRALAGWLQSNGIPVIGNVRYANEASKDFCCEGLPPNDVISVGSLGLLKDPDMCKALEMGLEFAVSQLHPRTILVYGGHPEKVFGRYRCQGITILSFPARINSRLNESQKRKSELKTQDFDAVQGRFF